MLSLMILPAVSLKKKNQHSLKKLVISVFLFLFKILFITIYCTSLTCIGQKRHKNSLNNRPTNQTTSEHLTERRNQRYSVDNGLKGVGGLLVVLLNLLLLFAVF